MRRLNDSVRQVLKASKILTSVRLAFSNNTFPTQQQVEARAAYISSQPNFKVETVQELSAL